MKMNSKTHKMNTPTQTLPLKGEGCEGLANEMSLSGAGWGCLILHGTQ